MAGGKDAGSVMYSTASFLRSMGTGQNGSASVSCSKIPEPAHATSTPLARRHRRSYTNVPQLGTRVNAFPHASANPRYETPPLRPRTPHSKENVDPDPPSPSTEPTLDVPARPPGGRMTPREANKSPIRPRVFHTTSIFNEDFLDLPALPRAWTAQHDRAICVLDSRNYAPLAIVSKLRRVFPELEGTLTPLMIDKRLCILDQNIDLDYWRVGTTAQVETREQRHVRWEADRVDSQTTLAENIQTPKSKRATMFRASPRRPA